MALIVMLIAYGLAMALPIIAAFRSLRRSAPGRTRNEIVILQLLTATAALAATILARMEGVPAPAGSWASVIDLDPTGWLITIIALIAAASAAMLPVSHEAPRRSMAALFCAQSAITTLAGVDDLRIMAMSLFLWSGCLAWAFVSNQGSPDVGHVPAVDAVKKHLGITTIGGLLVLMGAAVVIFADAAGVARASGEASHYRFDVSVLRETLSAASGSRAGIWNQLAPWAGLPLLASFAMLCGIVPFHRPMVSAIRFAPPELRTLVVMMHVSGGWIGGWKLFAPAMAFMAGDAPSLVMPLAMLTQWFGALLILARGDMPRLTGALAVYLTGLIVFAILVPSAGGIAAAWLLIVGSSLPLAGLCLLLSWLESTYGSREFSEFHGLIRRLPRFSLALTGCIIALCGAPGLSMFPGLWQAWVAREQSAAAPGFEAISLWPILIPHVIAIWGLLRLLDNLLLGSVRTPEMADVLTERVEIHQFGERIPQDLGRVERIVIAGLFAGSVLIGLWPACFNTRLDNTISNGRPMSQ